MNAIFHLLRTYQIKTNTANILLVMIFVLNSISSTVKSSNITYPQTSLLQIDCKQYNLVGEQCANYIAVYIQSYSGFIQTPSETYYVPSQGYSSFTVPQDTIFFPVEYFHLNETEIKSYGLKSTTTVTTLQVQCYLEFSKLYGIDDVASTLKSNVIFTLFWHDYRLAWNNSLTPIHYDYLEQDTNEDASIYLDTQTVSLSSEWVWTPALALLNSALDTDFLSSLTGSDRLEIFPSGLVKWKLKGNAETTCKLNLRMFPFDVQTCTLQLSSRAKQLINGLNFSIFESYASVNQALGSLAFPDGSSVLAMNYESSASWQTISSSGVREEQILIGDQFRNTQSVLVYSLTISRYSRFYISTGIIPNILVSLLALVSLWVTDYAARLGVTITAMLTIIAIMWSVTSNLPVTSTITWMDYFLKFCIIIVTMITMETCIVLHISSKKSVVPQWRWLRVFVNFCSWQYMFYLFSIVASICGDFWCDCSEVAAAIDSTSSNKNSNANNSNNNSSITTSKTSDNGSSNNNANNHNRRTILSLSQDGIQQQFENPSFNHSNRNTDHYDSESGGNVNNKNNDLIMNADGMQIDNNHNNNHNNHATNVKRMTNNTTTNNHNQHSIRDSEEEEEDDGLMIMYDDKGNKIKNNNPNNSSSKLMRFITWKRLARAIDFCSQFIFVVAYIVAFSYLFSLPGVVP